MYGYPLSHTNGSDFCVVRVIGTNVSARAATAWHQGKASIDPLLYNAPPEIHTAHESTCRVPYDIVEMILTHLTRDLSALKASSLVCHSWYTAAVPHLHRTLTLENDRSDFVGDEQGMGSTRDKLKPLSRLYERGHIPLVQEIRVMKSYGTSPWFVPQAFTHCDLRYFSAFTNVRTLVLQGLRIDHFIPGIECYFKHFSPTLQSITLIDSCYTPRQLSHFLSLFSNLDNIKIVSRSTRTPQTTIPDTELVPFSVPKLGGRLVVYDFHQVEVWRDLITSCGSLRFRYMNLHWVGSCAPVLFQACAKNLETLRFYASERSVSK